MENMKAEVLEREHRAAGRWARKIGEEIMLYDMGALDGVAPYCRSNPGRRWCKSEKQPSSEIRTDNINNKYK